MLPADDLSLPPLIPPANTAVREYGRTRASRLRAYIVNPAISLGLLAAALYGIHGDSPGGWAVLGLGVLIIALGIWLRISLGNAANEHFTLGHDLLEYTNYSGTRSFTSDDIQGYKTSEGNAYIDIQFKNSANLNISFDSAFEHHQEITQWLMDRYSDQRLVSARKAEQHVRALKQSLLANPTLGTSSEERQNALRSAQRIARWLNGAGVLTALSLWFPPEPPEWAIMAGLLVPLVAIGALWWLPHLLRVDGSDDNGYPSVLMALGLPGIAIWFSSSSYYKILNYATMWPIAIAVSVLVLLLLAGGSRQFWRLPKLNLTLAVLLPLLAFLYGYTTCSIANVQYDTSAGRTFTAQVLSVRMSSSRYQAFYSLALSAWGPLRQQNELSVSYHVYHNVHQGDDVPVVLHPGFLGVPWYRVVL